MLKQFELHQKGIKLPTPDGNVKKAKKRKTSTEHVAVSNDGAKKPRDEEPTNEREVTSGEKEPATPTKKEAVVHKKKVFQLLLTSFHGF